MFRRKIGEKATLLSKCGESLFGCSGETLVTQGIYVPKSLLSGPFRFICKRTVWVPDSLSHECLFHHLLFFGATLPFSVQKVASRHSFGLCGINPTRTIRAKDTSFLLLAKFPHKHFAVYGIVDVRQTCSDKVIFVERISTDRNEVLKCVDWMKNEVVLYQLSKEPKGYRTDGDDSTDDSSKQDDRLVESEMQEILQETHQNPIQQVSDETESDVLVNTSENPNPVPCEHENPPDTCFDGVDLPDPNTLFWIPFTPLQTTVEAPSYSTPFFITPQLSSM